MKRRKRGSKVAAPAETPVDAEKPPIHAEILADAVAPSAPAEIPVDAEKPPIHAEILADAEAPSAPAEMPADPEMPAAGSAVPRGADRRTYPRYAFTASVEIAAAESGARIKTRVRDLSWQGCYVDTDSPLPLETVADVRITKGAQSFEARARVVYTQTDKGMGLMFTGVEKEHLATLDTWLAESRETSWLASNRRRSQRVLMKIPVRVSGQTALASPFEEETHTLAISAHGALIPISTSVNRGQRLTLSNVHTKAALECVVAHIDRLLGQQLQVGVEFALPNPVFWGVAFPPKDWTPRHPDAKPRPKSVQSR
ncbi:MAG: hypothetical protein AUI53_03155 [Acidobacteria bacterium 13_1_40CM_2_60_7]|nr:MAG: hypothetical protein AUI53_03155 [Acidobacteria bacterium 13_1_40CM_2_60_7]PYU06703.1 MAG: hypothetical protein DMG33_07090 [Acidobacteriota bacterium]